MEWPKDLVDQHFADLRRIALDEDIGVSSLEAYCLMKSLQVVRSPADEENSLASEKSRPRLTDTEEHVLQCIERHPEGVTGQQISQETGISFEYVRQLLKREGTIRENYGVVNQQDGRGYFVIPGAQ